MNRSRPMTLPAVLTVLALVLAACGGAASSPAETDEPAAAATESAAAESEEPAESEEATAGEARVELVSSSFDPGELTISAGSTVVFLNADSFAHTVTEGTGGQATEDPIVDQDIADGETVDVTFDEPGTYEITCKFHPDMQMTITVEGRS